MTPQQILEQAMAEVAAMPPRVLPTPELMQPSVSLRDDIARHANDDFPREACGFVLSTGAVVKCTNVDSDPFNRFAIDPVEAEAWWATELVASVWHSHPTGPAVPSDDDAGQAVTGVTTLIYSVEDEDLGIYAVQGEQLVLLSMEGPE